MLSWTGDPLEHTPHEQTPKYEVGKGFSRALWFSKDFLKTKILRIRLSKVWIRFQVIEQRIRFLVWYNSFFMASKKFWEVETKMWQSCNHTRTCNNLPEIAFWLIENGNQFIQLMEATR